MGGKGETPTRSSTAASRGRVARLPCQGRTGRPLELALARAPKSVAVSSRLARLPLAKLTPCSAGLCQEHGAHADGQIGDASRGVTDMEELIGEPGADVD